MKKALVLPGGGPKGAFQVGALLYLVLEHNEQFDLITGSSVGALNGGFLAQYNKNELKQAVKDLEKMWRNVSNKDIKKHWLPFFYIHFLWKQSLYNTKPFEKFIDKKISTKKINESDVDLMVSTVSLNSGEHKIYDGNSEHICCAIKASAAFPGVFLPVNVDGELHSDGGIKEIAPLKSAIDAGATDITIISTGPLKPEAIERKELKTGFDVIKRAIALQNNEIVNNDLNALKHTNELIVHNLEAEARLVNYKIISPDTNLTNNIMDFEKEEISKMIEVGYTKAKEIFTNNK